MKINVNKLAPHKLTILIDWIKIRHQNKIENKKYHRFKITFPNNL